MWFYLLFFHGLSLILLLYAPPYFPPQPLLGVEGDPIAIVTPLIESTKADIVRLGLELGAPLALTWSCYRGEATPCGRCDACALRARGFAEAGAVDPALP